MTIRFRSRRAAPAQPWRASTRPLRVLPVLVAAACVAFLLPSPVSANHPQASGPFAITFDHDGDNEWWVEVLTRTSGGDTIVLLEARPESGAYRGLEEKGVVDGWMKWGPEQAFRIPPGDRVMFRAHMVDGATGAAGMVESCWFTHPQGVEQCAAPPSPWRTTLMGQAGASSSDGDMAVGDADTDGRRDVSMAKRDGFYTAELSGTWQVERVGTRASMSAVAVGDGDGDGRSEAYVMSDADLVRYQKVNGVWTETVLATLPGHFAGDMSLGNVDGQAGPEIYVTMVTITCNDIAQTCTGRFELYHVAIVQGAARVTLAATDMLGAGTTLWIGDGDNDGRSEVYIGTTGRFGQYVHQVRNVGGAWVEERITHDGEAGFLAVVGDAEHNGANEVYTLNSEGKLGVVRFVGGAWTVQYVIQGIVSPDGRDVSPNSLFIADGDNDGRTELYVGGSAFETEAAEVYQVRHSGGLWSYERIAHFQDPAQTGSGATTYLVVGDGDGDGRREVYAGASFSGIEFGEPGVTWLFQVSKGGSTAFEATFTNVRGNEWWIQANVAASGGTLAKVDVRLNDGDWKPLAKQSWGGWAASYRAVQGTIVQFRATSTTGATDLSDCYRWIPPSNTDATKVSCGTAPPPPPPPGFDATFSGVKGNEWWVQANVAGNQPIAKVEARVNCGTTWHTLTLQSWGGYAKSFHVPNGAKVDFRATSTTGATDMSGGYIWPNATPTTGC